MTARAVKGFVEWLQPIARNEVSGEENAHRALWATVILSGLVTDYKTDCNNYKLDKEYIQSDAFRQHYDLVVCPIEFKDIKYALLDEHLMCYEKTGYHVDGVQSIISRVFDLNADEFNLVLKTNDIDDTRYKRRLETLFLITKDWLEKNIKCTRLRLYMELKDGENVFNKLCALILDRDELSEIANEFSKARNRI